MSEKPSIIEKVFELKQEYQEMKDMIDLKASGSQELEFKPLYYPRLLDIRKDLSCLSLDLARETSKYLRLYKNDEAKRKTQFYLKKRDGIANKMKIGEAEAEAEVDIGDLRKSEALNEGLYSSARLILNQVNEVLKSLNQDISIIKKEYESLTNMQ